MVNEKPLFPPTGRTSKAYSEISLASTLRPEDSISQIVARSQPQATWPLMSHGPPQHTTPGFDFANANGRCRRRRKRTAEPPFHHDSVSRPSSRNRRRQRRDQQVPPPHKINNRTIRTNAQEDPGANVTAAPHDSGQLPIPRCTACTLGTAAPTEDPLPPKSRPTTADHSPLVLPTTRDRLCFTF